MAKQGINGWVVLVIALLAYAFIPGVQNAVNGIFGQVGPAPAPTSGGTTSPTICPIEDTTVQVDTNDKFSKATEASNGSHRIFVDNVDRGYVAEGGTFSVSPGQEYKVILVQNSTGYYPATKTGTVPCRGTLDVSGGVAIYDNSLTFTQWDENGQVITATGSVAVDMSADSVYTLPFKIAVTSKQSFGNPDHVGNGNVLCASYNRTAYDSFKVDGAKTAPVPNQISTGSTNETSCYYIPVIQNDPDVADGTKISELLVDGYYTGSWIVDTSSTYSDPGANTEGNLSYFAIDTAHDLDASTLAEIFDVEDETNNNLGVLVVQSAVIERV